MTSGREKFGYASCLEPSLCKTEGSTETSTASTSLYEDEIGPNTEAEACLHDDSIEFMFNERIFARRPRLKRQRSSCGKDKEQL